MRPESPVALSAADPHRMVSGWLPSAVHDHRKGSEA